MGTDADPVAFTNWELANETFYIPEQVLAADAVVLVGGFQGTFRAANWAKIAKKPLLPFPGFEGAGAKIFEEELNDFDAKYRPRREARLRAVEQRQRRLA